MPSLRPLALRLALAAPIACAGAGDDAGESEASGGSGSTSATSTSSASASSTSAATTSTATSTATGTATEGTATDAGSTGTTALTSPPETTGAPPDDAALCAAAAKIFPIMPSAEPVTPPGWGPGESINVFVVLDNTGPDFNWYPGIRVSADHPQVTSENPENWFYAIFSGPSAPIGVGFTADPSIPPGTLVTFTIETTVLNVECPDLPSITLEVTIE